MAKRRSSRTARDPHGPQVFHVTASDAQKSLVDLLHRWLRLSWSQARRFVDKRFVQVNGNLCVDVGRRLADGDVVHVFSHSQSPPPRENDVRIRYIDDTIVVVEKPSGMTTLRHPEERYWPSARRQRQPTLDECLNRIIAKRERSRSRRSASSPRVRPVHRLDRETSGLMVFARTVPAERDLIRQFAGHTIERKYLAIVVGELNSMTIESTLIRDRGDGRRGSAAPGETEKGKRAVTHVRLLEKRGGMSLVECQLETGRTHQIRIHLSERGHPVCGDKVYGAKKQKRSAQAAPRLALHATVLGLRHPTRGEAMRFEWPLPPDLESFWTGHQTGRASHGVSQPESQRDKSRSKSHDGKHRDTEGAED